MDFHQNLKQLVLKVFLKLVYFAFYHSGEASLDKLATGKGALILACCRCKVLSSASKSDISIFQFFKIVCGLGEYLDCLKSCLGHIIFF